MKIKPECTGVWRITEMSMWDWDFIMGETNNSHKVKLDKSPS